MKQKRQRIQPRSLRGSSLTTEPLLRPSLRLVGRGSWIVDRPGIRECRKRNETRKAIWVVVDQKIVVVTAATFLNVYIVHCRGSVLKLLGGCRCLLTVRVVICIINCLVRKYSQYYIMASNFKLKNPTHLVEETYSRREPTKCSWQNQMARKSKLHLYSNKPTSPHLKKNLALLTMINGPTAESCDMSRVA